MNGGDRGEGEGDEEKEKGGDKRGEKVEKGER